MKLIRRLEALPRLHGYAVTIGMFDGLHVGHRFILDSLRRVAKSKKLKTLLIGFENRRDRPSPKLVSEAEKRAMLSELGIDYLLLLDFKKVKPLSYEAFVEWLSGRLRVGAFIASDKLRIGRDRLGTPELVTQAWKRISPETFVRYHPSKFLRQKGKNEKISSSHIRELLEKGRVEAMSGFLGRPFSLSGKVVHGQKLGRKLGYPTLNLKLSEDLHSPKHGVYVARVHLGQKAYPAAAFIGPVRLPKGEGIPKNLQRITLEAHLLNFHKSVYNEEARIEFIKWVREPKAFATLDALKAAIAADVRRTERYFRPKKGNRRKEE